MNQTNMIKTRSVGRRHVLQMGGAGFAALALPLAARAQDPVKLTVWSWLPDLQLQIDMFTAANPGIEVELVNAGQVTPLIACTYPLAQIRQAMLHLEQGTAIGKIVITIPE